MPDRAAVVIQGGSVAAARQRNACIRYVLDRGYELFTIIESGGNHGDAVNLVLRGVVQVVIVAFGGRDLAEHVIGAGGRVEAVHPHPHVVVPPVPAPVEPPGISGHLLEMLRARGKTVREIADFVGESTVEIRRLLNRRK